MGEAAGEPDFVPLDHSEIEQSEMLSGLTRSTVK